MTIADIIIDDVLDTAYAWPCQRRKEWPASADVWGFRQGWLEEKEQLSEALFGLGITCDGG